MLWQAEIKRTSDPKNGFIPEASVYSAPDATRKGWGRNRKNGQESAKQEFLHFSKSL